VAAASFAVITAYVSITEGAAGDFFHTIGTTTMEVTEGALGSVEGWRGEREVRRVSEVLLEEPPRVAKKTPAPRKEEKNERNEESEGGINDAVGDGGTDGRGRGDAYFEARGW